MVRKRKKTITEQREEANVRPPAGEALSDVSIVFYIINVMGSRPILL